MLDQINASEQAALAALEAVTTPEALEQWRVTHLGRSSRLMTILGDIGKLSKEDRPAVGQRGNAVKRALEEALAAQAEAIRRAEMEHAMQAGAVDVTLPG